MLCNNSGKSVLKEPAGDETSMSSNLGGDSIFFLASQRFVASQSPFVYLLDRLAREVLCL